MECQAKNLKYCFIDRNCFVQNKEETISTEVCIFSKINRMCIRIEIEVTKIVSQNSLSIQNILNRQDDKIVAKRLP